MICEWFLYIFWRWDVVFTSASLAVLYLIVSWLTNPLRKVPGPPGSLLFGNSADLSRPHDGQQVLVEWGKEYGEIYKTWDIIGGYRIHIQDPEHLKDMLITNYTKFFKPTFLAKILDFKIAGKNLFTVNFKEHSQQRKLLNPSFSHGSVQTYLPIFRRITDNLCQVWKKKINEGGGKIEEKIQNRFTCLTLDVIGEAAFGYEFNSVLGGHTKESNAAEIILLGQFNFRRRALETYFPFLKLIPSREREKVDEAKDVLDNIFLKVIKERMQEQATGDSKNDLLQVLLNKRNSGEHNFEDSDILSQVRSFMIAGHETTSMTMTWTVLLLAKHQEYQERAREEIRRVLGGKEEVTFQDVKEMSFLDNCIKESMRLHPAIITANRETNEDMKIGPYDIPKNTKVQLDIASIHRNEKYWKDPDRYNPDRFDDETDTGLQSKELQFRYMPFSRGPRICIGYRFAELEVKITMAILLRLFHFRLGREQSPDLQAELAISLRPFPPPVIEISLAE